MRIATWNINSIRIRQAPLTAFVRTHKPDILCLQETKVDDPDFPHDMVKRLGFAHVLFSGQKSYNGVAILSRLPLKLHATYDVLKNGSKRHIAAELPDGTMLHNFYVPAGGDIPDPKVNLKFKEKLAFIEAMADWATQEIKAKHKVIALGDLNIAPYEHDVWSSKQLRDVVSHTPIEREKILALKDTIGWVDVARTFTPMEEKLYTWWSYRNRDWKASNRGRRLDHIWVTPALKSALKGHAVIKETRDWENTSDHVPTVVTVNG